ncbi:DNA-3-methyladenine glycosylase I [Flexibacterium corallicola]|uniref:DNA-3-methyladenine glycosylase I n=1 Tax=Flexibacterium corallicola TaxID=3037259 RepID=UPI00286F2E58|nr:DNA-3-methyladenine glycosylase I [Pseudovibrio sp. M1P-2-3]
MTALETEIPAGLLQDEKGDCTCRWHGGDAEYRRYHDKEWGRPVTNDIRLFEKICLEGFQSGLSWLTILRKRDNFRAAFAGFDFEKVAKFTQNDIERCVADKGIVRHRGKITSTINNANRALELREEFGSLAAYFWSWEPTTEQRPKKFDAETLYSLGKTEISTKISKDLKKRGWSFVGPTTVYAFMQAMGMVNDHLEGCIIRPVVEEARAQLIRPLIKS